MIMIKMMMMMMIRIRIMIFIQGAHFTKGDIQCRGRSRGRVQGVRTHPPPPPPEMTCGCLIQLVFCQKKKKKLCGLLVLK